MHACIHTNIHTYIHTYIQRVQCQQVGDQFAVVVRVAAGRLARRLWHLLHHLHLLHDVAEFYLLDFDRLLHHAFGGHFFDDDLRIGVSTYVRMHAWM